MPRLDPRSLFKDRLREHLAADHLELTAVNAGQTDGKACWLVTVRVPQQGLASLTLPIDDGLDLLSLEVADDVARRCVKALQPALPSL